MEFVGDYKTKKKLAEALRKREEGLLGMEAPPSTIVTPGSGAFPGQIQANWAAPIAQIAGAWMANKAGEKASAAEAEAETARMEGLRALIGGGAGTPGAGNAPGQPGTTGAWSRLMTPEGMMAAQSLDLDPSVLKMLMPEKQSLGAITQASATPAGRAALVQVGAMTQEQADKIGAAQDAAAAQARAAEREDYDYQQSHKAFAPDRGNDRAPTEMELFLQNPEQFERLQKLKAQSRPGAGGQYEKTRDKERAESDVKLIDSKGQMGIASGRIKGLISKEEKSPYTMGAEMLAKDTASQMVNPDFKWSEYNADVRQVVSDAEEARLSAMEAFTGHGAVTDAEQKILGHTVFSPYDQPADRMYKLKKMNEAIDAGMKKIEEAEGRFKAGKSIPDQGDLGPDLDSEIDALMGGQ